VKVSRSLFLLVLPLLLGACVSSSDIDELHTQLSDIQRQVLVLQKQTSSKQEVGDLQQQISAHTESLLKSEADVQVAVQNLSMQIDQLEANLEDTNYRLSQLSQQIAATNQELKSVRTTLGATGGPAETSQPPMTPPSDPQSLYQTAYNDYLRGNYDLAILGFRQYLETFPDTELADNAAYWIGESFFSQAKYQQAISEFDEILRRFPRSDKQASALLKKLNALPLEETVASATKAMATADDALLSLKTTLASEDTMIKGADTKALSGELTATLQKMRFVLDGFSRNADLYKNLNASLRSLDSTLNNTKSLTRQLSDKPNSLVLPASNEPDPIPRAKQQ